VASRALRNPLSLVVLGLLAEQPLHPYGMRVLMRDRGHDRIVKARPASLYDAVTRLAGAGLVEVQESRRAGRRPERTVYRITDSGKIALQTRVREGLADLGSSERFVAALSFMYALPKREVVALLRQRTSALAGLIDTAERALRAARESGVSEIFLSEEYYGQALRLAERDWLTDFVARLHERSLSWPSERPRAARQSVGDLSSRR
jgi:DNA-binding PadR family transcriptional regulator